MAINKYGKGFEIDREPILPVICVNELDVDKVEEELLKNNYYGYKGVLCFSCVSFHGSNNWGLLD